MKAPEFKVSDFLLYKWVARANGGVQSKDGIISADKGDIAEYLKERSVKVDDKPNLFQKGYIGPHERFKSPQHLINALEAGRIEVASVNYWHQWRTPSSSKYDDAIRFMYRVK